MKNTFKFFTCNILKFNLADFFSCFFLLFVPLLFTMYLLFATFAYSQSGWEPDTQLVFMQGSSWYPRAACCGDTIHLVWWQHYAFDEVFYKRSTDAGMTWETDVRLTPEDSISCVLPKIAVWENNIHVIWYEFSAYHYALCYINSTDGGDTWSAVDTLRKELEGGWGDCWLCAQGSNVNVVFIREDSKLVFMKSTDNGMSWSSQQEIGEGSGNPHIKIFNANNAYLAACVRFPVSSIEIYFYRSIDAGATWIDTQLVSDNDGFGSQLPMMDNDDSFGIHITWYDYKYSPYAWTGDIFYRASRDSGNAWGSIDSLSVQHRAVASEILAEGNNLHLVWEDDRNGFDDNFEIYYRMSTDLGLTWGSEVRLTNAQYKSICPSLTCRGGYLHLFWQDRRNDSMNVTGKLYYKRKDLSYSIAESEHFSLPSQLKANIHHNPFERILGIALWSLPKDLDIEIYDISGRQMFNYEMRGKDKEIEIDMKDLPCGVYFLRIITDGEWMIKKVVKVK